MKKPQKFDPTVHHRHSIRKAGFDYSRPGLYFVTICCQNKERFFGHIIDAKMVLNDAGKMVESEWLALKNRFPGIALHAFVVMPNHFHAILELTVGATLVVAQNDHDPSPFTVVAQNDHDPQSTIPSTIDETNHPNAIITSDQQNPFSTVPQTDLNPQMNRRENHKDFKSENENATIDDVQGQPQGVAPTRPTVGDVVHTFKSITTVKYIRGVQNAGWEPFDRKLWQRNYWERIIRDGTAYHQITGYIVNNPSSWADKRQGSIHKIR